MNALYLIFEHSPSPYFYTTIFNPYSPLSDMDIQFQSLGTTQARRRMMRRTTTMLLLATTGRRVRRIDCTYVETLAPPGPTNFPHTYSSIHSSTHIHSHLLSLNPLIRQPHLNDTSRPPNSQGRSWWSAGCPAHSLASSTMTVGSEHL